jgi:glycosyltransferase involved in cell wall biosynthesis
MKLLVFAHTPPPHHGQSYMVQLMLAGFGGDHRKRRHNFVPRNAAGDIHGIQCYHVNNRLSRHLEDIGEFRGGKVFVLLAHCFEAIWCRFRYGVTNFYYIPAPGKKSALYRDWLVMFLCRPFFKTLILHWHAAGLAKWLETTVQIRTRSLTYRGAKNADLSMVLSRYNVADAQKLYPQRVRIVNNGIPDPCADFAESVLPLRRARFAARARLFAGEQIADEELERLGNPQIVRVLYLAHCIKEKGLFDAVQGTVTANRLLAERKVNVRMKLFAAGAFVTPEEKQEFDAQMSDPEVADAVEAGGFVSGSEKLKVFREADLFCFPTYYLGENQPVNIIEALAHGLPIVTTQWRSLPEMLPADYPGLVPIRSPREIGKALLNLMAQESGESLRTIFLQRFTLERHLAALAEAITSIQHPHVTATQTPRAVTH